jgi:hypothetical protein
VADDQDPGSVTIAGRSFSNAGTGEKACLTRCWDGSIGFVVTGGASIGSLEGMHLHSVLPEGTATGSIAVFGGVLPVGIYALRISTPSVGGLVRATLYLPGELPSGTGRIFLFNYTDGTVQSLSAAGAVASMEAVEGGPMDNDGVADGVLTLMVGPGTASSSSSLKARDAGADPVGPMTFEKYISGAVSNVCYGTVADPTSVPSSGGSGGGGCSALSGLPFVGALLLAGFMLFRTRKD